MWALQLFRRIVSQSLNNVDDGAESVLKKCSKPFSFEENKGNSEFEIVQILRDEEYQYGVEYNSEKIVMEWLYRKSLKTNRKVTIFERTMQKVNLGVYVRKKCEAYKDQIPPETLLLSFFNKLKLKTDIFKTVYSGITDVLVFMSDDYEDTRFLDALLPKVIDGKKEKLLEFLTAIDIGIKDITYKEKETLFFTFHKGADGELYPLNLYDESEGTIKSNLNIKEVQNDKLSFLKSYISFSVFDPIGYVQAFGLQTFSLWYPNKNWPDPRPWHPYIDILCYAESVGYEPGFVIKRDSLFPQYQWILENLYGVGSPGDGYGGNLKMFFSKIPIFSTLCQAGFYSCLLAFFGVYAVFVNRNKKMVLILSAEFGMWLTVLLSPVIMYRYCAPFIFTAPLYVSAMFLLKKTCVEKHNAWK